MNRSRHNVVITTNFDHLVEDAIAITENEAVQSFNHTELAGFVQSRAQQPAVAKIHGDILLRSFNAAEELENLSAPWKDALRTLFRTYTPVVIGYGGNDPGFMAFLLEEMKSWQEDRRCFWFVRQESSFHKIPSNTELAGIPVLRVVECPGFTELMVLLDETFDYKSLSAELVEKTEEIAAELAAAIANARGDVEKHQQKLRDDVRTQFAEVRAVTVSSVDPLEVVEISPQTWQEWWELIEKGAGTAERKDLISQALANFSDSLPLRAAILVSELEESPSDSTKIGAIREILLKAERESGPDHPDVISILYSLGTAQWILSENENAEATFRRVIASRQRVLGPEHLDTLNSRYSLAGALYSQYKYGEAEKECRAALAIQERLLGSEDPRILINRSNLGTALYVQERYMEAEQEYRAVFEIERRILGLENPATLNHWSNVARSLCRQGKNKDSEQIQREVLAIREKIFDPSHPDVFSSYYELAICLKDQGKKKEALELAGRVLEGRTKIFGDEHLKTKAAKLLVAELESL